MKSKVFCIGFHKTGTTSLKVALKQLGYRVTGPNGTKDPGIADNVFAMADRLVPRYDAFQDNPWPVLYRYVDENFPGSKFIVTWRDPEAWIRSQCKHFGTRETPMRRWIYGAGCPVGNEDRYVERFVRHYDEIKAHFAGRDRDVLWMDLAAGDGWAPLCRFLGARVPDAPFPTANTAEDRARPKSWSVRMSWRLYALSDAVKRRLGLAHDT